MPRLVFPAAVDILASALMTRFLDAMEEELARAVQSMEKPLDLETSFTFPTPPPTEQDSDAAPTRGSVLERLLEEMRFTPSPPLGPPAQPSSELIDFSTSPIKKEPDAAQRSYTSPPTSLVLQPPERSYTPHPSLVVVILQV